MDCLGVGCFGIFVFVFFVVRWGVYFWGIVLLRGFGGGFGGIGYGKLGLVFENGIFVFEILYWGCFWEIFKIEDCVWLYGRNGVILFVEVKCGVE